MPTGPRLSLLSRASASLPACRAALSSAGSPPFHQGPEYVMGEYVDMTAVHGSRRQHDKPWVRCAPGGAGCGVGAGLHRLTICWFGCWLSTGAQLSLCHHRAVPKHTTRRRLPACWPRSLRRHPRSEKAPVRATGGSLADSWVGSCEGSCCLECRRRLACRLASVSPPSSFQAARLGAQHDNATH